MHSWNAPSATRSSRDNLRPNAIAPTVERLASAPRVVRLWHASGGMLPEPQLKADSRDRAHYFPTSIGDYAG